MKLVCRWIALLLVLSACAGQMGRQRPEWEQPINEARRNAAAGKTFECFLTPVQAGASSEGGVYVFYNNPHPFCYSYIIPGNWVRTQNPSIYRSENGDTTVSVDFYLPKVFENFDGATLLERTRTNITCNIEKKFGLKLSGVELVRFDSTRPGTWKWKAAPIKQGIHLIEFPPIFIVDLSPDAIVIINIMVKGTSNVDGLARSIIDTLKTTSAPECYWSDLERMLKVKYGNR